jgi:hypothetical protein
VESIIIREGSFLLFHHKCRVVGTPLLKRTMLAVPQQIDVLPICWGPNPKVVLPQRRSSRWSVKEYILESVGVGDEAHLCIDRNSVDCCGVPCPRYSAYYPLNLGPIAYDWAEM